ncbi:MAG TPA: sugar phosphate isomerase/epimerase [Kofleriaceae bacterium]|nr:sugar phosphate isomerase/epimerase [Kofleriaceae bacterium]
MLLGYNTNGFASHALPDALTVIAGLGYRSVGLTLDHAALDPRAPDLAAQVRRVRALLRELDLLPVVETGARFLLDPWRKHRPTLLEDAPEERRHRADFLARAIDIAAELGAPAVSLWSGGAPEGSPAPPAELDRRLAGELAPLCERAAAAGLVIAFEPEPGMHIESMADFARITALVAHPALRLTLDVGHAHLTEPSAPGAVREHAALLANVHLEGMRRPVHDHLPPWEGDLDLGAVLDALDEVGYAGPATFELSRHSHAAVDTARRAIDFVRGLRGGRGER